MNAVGAAPNTLGMSLFARRRDHRPPNPYASIGQLYQQDGSDYASTAAYLMWKQPLPARTPSIQRGPSIAGFFLIAIEQSCPRIITASPCPIAYAGQVDPDARQSNPLAKPNPFSTPFAEAGQMHKTT